jgi:hypothetical protein
MIRLALPIDADGQANPLEVSSGPIESLAVFIGVQAIRMDRFTVDTLQY